MAIVTDSTSMLPESLVVERGITVVRLQVVIGARAYDEGTQATPETVAEALREWTPVSTSRPSPQEFLEVYRGLAADGAEAIVSIHLSGEVSGTYESAQLAARESPVPVEAVDTRQVGMATGFAVLSAADALDAGDRDDTARAVATTAAAVAVKRAAATRVLFYVDTLEYLRRGGRIGAAAKLLGSALAVKPLLQVQDGRIVPLEKVRTSARAVSRLEDLAVEYAGVGDVDVAVAHLANPDRAEDLAEHLRKRLSGERSVVVGEVGAVIGAHVGPGMLAVAVSPRP